MLSFLIKIMITAQVLPTSATSHRLYRSLRQTRLLLRAAEDREGIHGEFLIVLFFQIKIARGFRWTRVPSERTLLSESSSKPGTW